MPANVFNTVVYHDFITLPPDTGIASRGSSLYCQWDDFMYKYEVFFNRYPNVRFKALCMNGQKGEVIFRGKTNVSSLDSFLFKLSNYVYAHPGAEIKIVAEVV